MAGKVIDIDKNSTLVQDEILIQFGNKDNIIAYIQEEIDQGRTLFKVLDDMLFQSTIGDASGFNLDIVGALVGQPRELGLEAIYIPLNHS